MKLNKKQLLELLIQIREEQSSDLEDSHIKADNALLAYISDPEIVTAYHAIDKWYA